MNHLTDAEVLAIREKAFEEARKYTERYRKALERIMSGDHHGTHGYCGYPYEWCECGEREANEALNG